MAEFGTAEYEARLERVKRRMAAAGIEALVCSDPANMNYLTGYDGWSFYVHQCVVVALGEAAPIWIGREMDAAGARLTTWLPAGRLHGYAEELVDNERAHPMQAVAAVLRGAGLARASIGVESDCFYFPARAAEVLRAELPDARLVDGFALVNRVRLVKSPAEIERMRIAGRIVSRAMAEGVEAIAPGVRECDVAARVTAAQLAGTPEHFGDYPAALASVPGGARTAAPHLTWSGARYRRGEGAFLELAGCHARYHAALARTVHLGPPPEALVTLSHIVEDGLEAALDALRAGRSCEDVEAAWRRLLARSGHDKRSRIGYSIGLGYPPDWGERTLSLRPGERTALAADMCFHVILGIWTGRWGYELSETCRVTAEGAPELLTSFPRELVVKP